MLDQRTRKAELHLTYKCDLDCPGCNRGCFNKKNLPPDMTLGTFDNTLNEIEDLGFAKDLVFIGGEPTLHRECIEFMRTGAERGFRQTIWSNSYSSLAKSKIGQIIKEDLATVVTGTHKLNGAATGFSNPYIFCSPVDLGTERVAPCKWGTGESGCGYSVDENQCTPCPIGGIIAHFSTPNTLAPLKFLLRAEYMNRVFQDLCGRCGSFLQLDECWNHVKRSKIENVNGTLMTEFWRKAFQV